MLQLTGPPAMSLGNLLWRKNKKLTDQPTFFKSATSFGLHELLATTTIWITAYFILRILRTDKIA